MQILTVLFGTRTSEQTSQTTVDQSTQSANSTTSTTDIARLYLSYPFYLNSRVSVLPV
jgi:hypothetical protein